MIRRASKEMHNDVGQALMKNRPYLVAILAVSLAGFFPAGAYGKKKIKVIKSKHKTSQTTGADASVEPDKVLYDRAVNAVKHSKYTEARLEYQTLINTYPDSEYLAKAKLGIADSYYKEGGVSNLTQAIDAYKSFIVFFPFLDEAAYAQTQVAMAHYKMMEKSDRDTTEAQAAENELQTFLLKYPQSPLAPKAEQHLREVQEVLADGEYRIARFYYLKPDFPAAAARLMEVSERYPLYSRSDEALWMLGDIYMRAKQASRNEDDKNHWADLAGKCYDRIARYYPLSARAGEARARLKEMGMHVPTAEPDAIARMRKSEEYSKKHHEFVLLRLPAGLIESRPDVVSAARVGSPNLNPPDDVISATDVLKQGAPGPAFDIATANAAPVNTDNADAHPAPAEIVTDSSSSAPASDVGVQIIEAPGAGNSSGAASTSGGGASSTVSNDNSSTVPADNAASSGPPAPSTLSGVSNDPSQPASTTTNSASPAAASSDPSESSPGTASSSQDQSSAPQSGQANSTGSSQSEGQSASKADPKSESTSKKKKGLHKIVPF